jgi:hypothetical protein
MKKTADEFFYEVLETRNNIKDEIVKFMKYRINDEGESYLEPLLEILEDEGGKVFMPSSKVAEMAKQDVKNELSKINISYMKVKKALGLLVNGYSHAFKNEHDLRDYVQ